MLLAPIAKEGFRRVKPSKPSNGASPSSFSLTGRRQPIQFTQIGKYSTQMCTLFRKSNKKQEATIIGPGPASPVLRTDHIH